MTMTTAEARRVLDAAGALDRDVVLPGEATASVRQGALRVVENDEWEVRADEYGESTLLLRTPTESAALEYLLDRVMAPLPAPLSYPRARLQLQRDAMARMVEPIAVQLRERPGATVNMQLPEGAVVDRFGTFDGVRVHPAGTQMAARSLPPDALDPRLADYGLLNFGVVAPMPVRARLVEPWFGQPGGGVVFRLAGEDQTVRDAVRSGRLRWLHIVEDEGQGSVASD